jgi:hypothetical protein
MPASLRRLLRVATALLAFALYLWVAAVRSVGRVKARKRARRAARRQA